MHDHPAKGIGRGLAAEMATHIADAQPAVRVGVVLQSPWRKAAGVLLGPGCAFELMVGGRGSRGKVEREDQAGVKHCIVRSESFCKARGEKQLACCLAQAARSS